MRFFELAKKYGFDGKALLAEIQKEGFEVRNTLASATPDVEIWLEAKVAGGWTPPEPEGKVKKAAKKPVIKKKAAARPKRTIERTTSTEKSATETETDGKPKEQENATKAPRVKVKKRVLRAGESAVTKKGEPEPAKVEAAAEVPVAPAGETEMVEAEHSPDVDTEKGKTKEEDKPKKKSRVKQVVQAGGEGEGEEAEKKKKGGKRSRVHDAEDDFVEDIAEESEPSIKVGDVVVQAEKFDRESLDESAQQLLVDDDEEFKRTGAKHKRADFRSKSTTHALPAGFAEMNSALARSVTGGGKRRRSRRPSGTRGRRTRRRRGAASSTVERDPNAISVVRAGMTLRDVSVALGIKLTDIMGYMMKSGQMVQVNDVLGEEDISRIADEFEIKYEFKAEHDFEQYLEDQALARLADASEEDLVARPPVITFLGHVDHGKTSLLDRIRATRVADGESGGITQHVGAYCIEKNGQLITFLDTPGHEAFTEMRARGADLTDIAVLVVAADDGVMPQTEEAVSHIRNAGVPLVVAINKIDLANANPDRVRQELSTRLGLLPEEWGGQVGMVEVSAQTGENIEELLERILLEAEVLELEANPDAPASGYVIEAKVTENQGVVATILIKDGTLRRGDVVLCTNGYGKVKIMVDEHGHTIDAAGPGHPVRVVGLSAVPESGDKVYVLDDLLKARAIAEERERTSRSKALSRRSHVTLENLTAHLASSATRELNLIVKADVMGSLEVLRKTLTDLSTDEVRINIVHSAVGGINQADIILADASDALVVGFHVIADSSARLQAAGYGVQVKFYHIIYRLIEDMKAALEGMLPPEEKEVVQGHLDIRQVFRASRLGNIAGCFVTDGFITRTSRARLTRDSVVIYDGTLASLRRIKDDAREVRSGFECGVKITGYEDIKEGDVIEAYMVEEIARKLE